MLGQSQSPLVSGGRTERWAASRWLAVLVVGFLIGSGLVVTAAWLLGVAIGLPGADQGLRLGVLLVALAIFLPFDLHAWWCRSSSRLGLRRQTPEWLKLRFRRREAVGLVWGADIGAGITTFRVTSAIWVVLLAILLGLVPAYIGLLYGVGLSVAVVGLVLRGWVGEALRTGLPRLVAARRPLQATYAVSATALAALAVLAILGS